MKLWLVETNEFDYDESDAFVVRAENEDAAFELINNGKCNLNFKRETTAITQVMQHGKSEIILNSFNAG